MARDIETDTKLLSDMLRSYGLRMLMFMLYEAFKPLCDPTPGMSKTDSELFVVWSDTRDMFDAARKRLFSS